MVEKDVLLRRTNIKKKKKKKKFVHFILNAFVFKLDIIAYYSEKMTQKPNLHFVVDVERKIQNKNIRNADSSILSNNQFGRERERKRESNTEVKKEIA